MHCSILSQLFFVMQENFNLILVFKVHLMIMFFCLIAG